MGGLAEKLTKLRRQEQEVHSYAASSRWYTSLSNAISYLARAEAATDPIEKFREAWAAAYNLFMMHGDPGDDEFKRFARWVTEMQGVPDVRRLAREVAVTSFVGDTRKGKNALLKDAQKGTWREGYQYAETWGKAVAASAEKAVRYFFTIVRDVRNACMHPGFNPNAAATKKALRSGADCLMPIVAAATAAAIEHPVEGTTGKATAYRSFLWPFLKNSDSFFSDYYLERLFPDEELTAIAEDTAIEQLKAVAKRFESAAPSLAAGGAEATVVNWCGPVLFPMLGVQPHSAVRIVTDAGVFEPSQVLAKAELTGKPRDEYQAKDAGRDLACLMWVLPWRTSLDATSTDPAFDSLPLMEIAHRALARSDVAWAVLTNGRQLRLLGKGTAHKPRCFLDVDLDAIVDRRGDTEAKQAFRYLLGLFSGSSFTEKDDKDRTRLERVLDGSERHGKEIGDELKANVFHALEELGDGFLHYLDANHSELKAWRDKRAANLSLENFLHSDELLTDIYHESLSLMYRLLFLFYAESRDLLPMETELYRETYSLESIRDEIISVHDDPDPKRFFGKGTTDLWDRLKELFAFVEKGWRNIIPAYNGGLFDPELHEFLERCKIGDYYLAQAIDLLSRTQPRAGQSTGEGRKKVTYRDLDVRHLGSIYEGILEYSAHIAGEDLAVMKRGTSGKTYEEYAPVHELSKEEKQQLKAYREAVADNPDNPKLPRGCLVTGLKEKGKYFLVYGGRESKRRSSGSYYTPDNIVQYIVENTLGPLLRGEGRDGDKRNVALTSDEILDVKVLDPAMGSGHFLVAATEYLSRAYGQARIREAKDKDGVMSDAEFIRYKRIVAERCIYGVDINPMAVELAKLSLWLFTMGRGRPLSFLNHHLKYGNSLIGAWIHDLGQVPSLRGRRREARETSPSEQGNLFERQFKARVPLMVRDVFGIMRQETLTYDDVQAKKALEGAIEEIKRQFKNLADLWVSVFFGEIAADYENLLLHPERARFREVNLPEAASFFHWQLEFPEVFYDSVGRPHVSPGFDVVVSNPPYDAALSEAQATFLDERVNVSGNGRLDTAALFIERFLLLLRRGGSLSFLLPHRLLSRKRDFGNHQAWIYDQQKLVRVCYLGTLEDIGANDEFTILFFSAEHTTEPIQISTEWDPTLGALDPAPLERSLWGPPGYRFNLYLPQFNGRILASIERESFPLGEIAESKDGIVPFIREKLVAFQRKDARYRPLLGVKGRYVLGRYSCTWEPTYICYDFDEAKKWIKDPTELRKVQLREEQIFLRPQKIITAQDAIVPRGTIDRKRFFHTNSIHSTYFKVATDYDLRYVLAFLNSPVLGYYYQTLNLKGQDLHPQILVTNLPLLPIRRVEFKNDSVGPRIGLDERALTEVVDAVRSVDRESGLARWVHDAIVFIVASLLGEDVRIKSLGQRENLLRILDQIIACAVGLTEGQTKEVLTYLTSRGVRYTSEDQ
jgi:type I restriction-modification system DNA methylase subunit